MTPGQHCPVMVRQGKGRGDMHMPPSGVVRNPGSHFDQTLDQPVDGPPHFLSPDGELADLMQEVAGQNRNKHFPSLSRLSLRSNRLFIKIIAEIVNKITGYAP